VKDLGFSVRALLLSGAWANSATRGDIVILIFGVANRLKTDVGVRAARKRLMLLLLARTVVFFLFFLCAVRVQGIMTRDNVLEQRHLAIAATI